jgi:subtilisin family serine protease
MKKLPWLLLPLVVLLAVLLSQTQPGVAQEIDRAEDNPKIDRWVIAHTAAGEAAEFLVVLTERADLRGADRLATKAAKGRYVYETLFAHAQRAQAPLVAWLEQRGVEYRSFYIINAIWVKADRATALTLAARSDVARLDGNPLIHNELAQPETPIGLQLERAESIEPGIAYVRAPQVWDLGFTGQGIVVGGQDTGYRWDHEALKVQYRGWDGVTVTHDYNWHDSIHSGGGSCGANSPAPCDDYGHGTHTMGTVLGDNGADYQIGMAPGAQWIGCRNMNVGNGTPATYLECFEFFLAPYPITGTVAQGDPSKAPDITNNSWSCPASEGCNAASLLEAMQVQRAAGILTVVSASNHPGTCSSIVDPPGIYAEAYTVGALNTGTDTRASFSNRGPVTVDGSARRKPDITAPGTGTLSSTRTATYTYGSMSGTSMAAPHVAGAVALLWSARPELRNQITATEQLLNESAVPIFSTECGSNGWPNNSFGYGRLDILAAMLGVAVSPDLNGLANPGSSVNYTVWLTNTGVTTDSFTLDLGAAKWPSSIALTETVAVAAGASLSTTVTITVPQQTAAYLSDSVTVTVASQTAPQRSMMVLITTTAQAVHGAALYPTVSEQISHPGQWVTYTLRLTNTGNVTQTYALGLAGNRPGVLSPYTTTLEAGLGQAVQAAILLPPAVLDNGTSFVLAWYDTFTGTLAAYARLDTIVATKQLYLPVILK